MGQQVSCRGRERPRLKMSRQRLKTGRLDPVRGGERISSLSLVLQQGTEQRALTIAGINGHLYREADAQGFIRRRGFCQSDFYREPLYHLHPIAGGVLRRQQGEGGTGAGAQAVNLPAVDIAGVDVRANLGGLSYPYVGELR